MYTSYYTNFTCLCSPVRKRTSASVFIAIRLAIALANCCIINV